MEMILHQSLGCRFNAMILYHFIQFGRHASHPIFSDTGNDFFSIFPIFWNSLCFSHGQVLAELNEMVQYPGSNPGKRSTRDWSLFFF